MKILIVGGAGYIGSHVARAFLDSGHAVTVFDNLSSGFRENLFPEAGFVEGDLMDPAGLDACLGGDFDGIVHLAALKSVGESMLKPEKYSANNIAGTLNLLNAAAAAGVKRFVFSSSAAVYGEPEYLPVDEAHPVAPANYYGFTKLEIERFLAWYDKLKGLRSACLRYFNAAGYDPAGRIAGLEKNPANLLPVVMEAACGLRPEVQVFGDDYDTRDGTGLRDYVHVSDLAAAHVAAFDYLVRADSSLTVNLGSETGYTVLELIAAARRLTGRPVPAKIVGRRSGDPAALYSTSAKAKELLGYAPKHSDIDSLVSTTWAAYRRHHAV